MTFPTRLQRLNALLALGIAFKSLHIQFTDMIGSLKPTAAAAGRGARCPPVCRPTRRARLAQGPKAAETDIAAKVELPPQQQKEASVDIFQRSWGTYQAALAADSMHHSLLFGRIQSYLEQRVQVRPSTSRHRYSRCSRLRDVVGCIAPHAPHGTQSRMHRPMHDSDQNAACPHHCT